MTRKGQIVVFTEGEDMTTVTSSSCMFVTEDVGAILRMGGKSFRVVSVSSGATLTLRDLRWYERIYYRAAWWLKRAVHALASSLEGKG